MNTLPKSQFDKAQNLDPVPQIALHPFRRQSVRSHESLPSGLGGAILTDARGHLLANLRQASIHLGLRGNSGPLVFFADLLLDQRAPDQLLQGPLSGKYTQSHLAGV